MKTITNRLETRFGNNTIKFGKCFSPYAVAAIELLKKYNRNNGELDIKTMWQNVEEDVAKYVAKGEMSDNSKSPWDVKFENEKGKTEFWEIRSLRFLKSDTTVNFASSSDHAVHNYQARPALERKWNQIDGYFVCDSDEYSSKGFFRWWKIPVETVEQLYRNNLWAHPHKGKAKSKWSVRRTTPCFTRTMNKLFNEEKTQIYF